MSKYLGMFMILAIVIEVGFYLMYNANNLLLQTAGLLIGSLTLGGVLTDWMMCRGKK